MARFQFHIPMVAGAGPPRDMTPEAEAWWALVADRITAPPGEGVPLMAVVRPEEAGLATCLLEDMGVPSADGVLIALLDEEAEILVEPGAIIDTPPPLYAMEPDDPEWWTTVAEEAEALVVSIRGGMDARRDRKAAELAHGLAKMLRSPLWWEATPSKVTIEAE